MTIWKYVALAFALVLPYAPATAADYKIGDLTLTNAWTRATPPKAKAGGGFIQITNNGSETDILVSASSSISKKVELHEMSVTDGIMKMRELANGIEIPAGETVSLKPGGLHIMFMGLVEGLQQGATVPVTLTFENAGQVKVELSVAKMGAKHNHNHHKHDHKEHTH